MRHGPASDRRYCYLSRPDSLPLPLVICDRNSFRSKDRFSNLAQVSQESHIGLAGIEGSVHVHCSLSSGRSFDQVLQNFSCAECSLRGCRRTTQTSRARHSDYQPNLEPQVNKLNSHSVKTLRTASKDPIPQRRFPIGGIEHFHVDIVLFRRWRRWCRRCSKHKLQTIDFPYRHLEFTAQLREARDASQNRIPTNRNGVNAKSSGFIRPGFQLSVRVLVGQSHHCVGNHRTTRIGNGSDHRAGGLPQDMLGIS